MKLLRGIILVSGLAILAAVLILVASPARLHAQDKQGSGKSVGFVLSDDATAKDVGLPVYPGAEKRTMKGKDDDSPALQMGLWGGSSGFKLVVLKLQSKDSPEKVADFYRKALARYGHVLDCGKSSGKPEKTVTANDLNCESDHPVAGGFTLKAGTKQKQHVVGVEPDNGHSNIDLVYVQAPPDSKTD